MKRVAIIGGLVVAVLAVAVYRAKLSAEETQVRIDELKIESQAEEAAIASLRADGTLEALNKKWFLDYKMGQ